MIQFCEKIDKNIFGPNLFNPKFTRPKLFQTERTQRLACLPSFRELVLICHCVFLVYDLPWHPRNVLCFLRFARTLAGACCTLPASQKNPRSFSSCTNITHFPIITREVLILTRPISKLVLQIHSDGILYTLHGAES